MRRWLIVYYRVEEIRGSQQRLEVLRHLNLRLRRIILKFLEQLRQSRGVKLLLAAAIARRGQDLLGQLDGVLLLEKVSILIKRGLLAFRLMLLKILCTLPIRLLWRSILLLLLAHDVDHHFFVKLFLTLKFGLLVVDLFVEVDDVVLLFFVFGVDVLELFLEAILLDLVLYMQLSQLLVALR